MRNNERMGENSSITNTLLISSAGAGAGRGVDVTGARRASIVVSWTGGNTTTLTLRQSASQNAGYTALKPSTAAIVKDVDQVQVNKEIEANDNGQFVLAPVTGTDAGSMVIDVRMSDLKKGSRFIKIDSLASGGVRQICATVILDLYKSEIVG